MLNKESVTMSFSSAQSPAVLRKMGAARVRFGCMLISFFLTTIGLAAEPAPSDVKQQLDGMLVAANAHDADRFMAAYAHTPDLVVVFDDMKISGWQPVRDQQEKWWDGGKTDVVYSLRSPAEVTQVDKDVIVTFQRLASTRTDSDGAKKTVNLNATSVWRKGTGGWKIVVAHESFVR